VLLEKHVHLQKEVGAAWVRVVEPGRFWWARLLDARVIDVRERSVSRSSSSWMLRELRVSFIMGVVGDAMVLSLRGFDDEDSVT
jgi:hypothetical protein